MTNYLMVAIQVGDALKYSTNFNEIDRAAQSIFSFSLEEFPAESISSVRAKRIYNWVLSLAKQPMKNSDRDNQLIKFLDLLTQSDEDIAQIDKILNQAGIDYQSTEKKKIFYQRCFHPEINSHCSRLFNDGHYFHAVFEAAKIYHKVVQKKSNSTKEGQKLMLDVWFPNGVLKLTKCESETDKNVQEGLGFLSAGLMRAIRNPTAHEPAHEWPISEQDCLEILGFISFLMRKLDMAVYLKKNN